MAKAMLIMDMPSSCDKCELKVLPNPWSFMICGKTKKHIESGNQRPTWCPLREVPSKHEDGHTVKVAIENDCYDGFEYERAYCDGKDAGYNACIDEILGGAEHG